MVEAEAFFPWEEVDLAGADGIITLLAEQFGPGLQAAVLVIVAQVLAIAEDAIYNGVHAS
jgi:hypothetical protein